MVDIGGDHDRSVRDPFPYELHVTMLFFCNKLHLRRYFALFRVFYLCHFLILSSPSAQPT